MQRLTTQPLCQRSTNIDHVFGTGKSCSYRAAAALQGRNADCVLSTARLLPTSKAGFQDYAQIRS